MKQYRFEFDKFVKDLEKRSDRHNNRLDEDKSELDKDENELDEQEAKRDRARRYHEHPHNSIVYSRPPAVKNDN